MEMENKELVKVSHRGLVGGRLELGETLYVDRLVVPCQGETVSLPSFFYHYQNILITTDHFLS